MAWHVHQGAIKDVSGGHTAADEICHNQLVDCRRPLGM